MATYLSQHTHTPAQAHITYSHVHYPALIKKCFQRSSERLNGVLLLDAFGENITEGECDIPEGSLAVLLCRGIPGPGNIKERSRY